MQNYFYFFIFHYRDDDDINDVASMAGVNLNEESARIMATNSDLVGTQIQSCKDEPFLAAIPLHKRILEMGEKPFLLIVFPLELCGSEYQNMLSTRDCFLSILLYNLVS